MSSDDSSLLNSMKDVADQEPGASAGFSFAAGAAQMEMLRADDGSLNRKTASQIRQVRTGPGRRPGSRNKKNEKIAHWYIAEYGDPLAALGEIINTPPHQIYDMMVLAQGGEEKGKRITGRDALEFWKSALLDLMPYIHSKQPIAVDVTGKADAVIFIPGLNAPTGFTTDQLGAAADALGVSAIEREGIRMVDGELLRPEASAVDCDEDVDGGRE